MGRRGRFVCGVVAAFLGGAACSGPGSSPAPPATGGDIVVGVPLAATGGLAQEGALVKQGYDMWLDWANRDGGILVRGVRHRVRALYADDTSDPKVDAQLAETMVTEQNAQFLLGPYSSASTATAAAVADKHRVPMV